MTRRTRVQWRRTGWASPRWTRGRRRRGTIAKSNIGVDGLFDAVAQKLLKLYIKERENELLRAREHRSSASGRAPSPNDDSFVRRREDSFNRKLKIGESRANSRRSEGCC